MLKYIRGVVLIATVLLMSACVSPTHAASADIVITQIQAGGVGVAQQEVIILYNNTSYEVDITNWCLTNKSNVEFACFSPHTTYEHIILPARGYATIGSTSAATYINYATLSLVYTVTNQSSGSIVGSNDTITLINKEKAVVDRQAWSTSLSGGMVLARRIIGAEPTLFIDTDQASDWAVQLALPFPNGQVIQKEILLDECPNLEGDQLSIPDNMEVNETGDCVETIAIPELLPIKITELLPNALGSDAGKEFVELYNPNQQSVSLDQYVLWYGLELDESITFPNGMMIPGLSYFSFSNADLGFTLINTSGRVRIMVNESTVDETPAYEDPDDDESWAFINGNWQYTNRPTPGMENLISDESLKVENEADVQKPCASNQYRSPETNRCRLVTTNASTVTPCKDNQYRSEQTNRCRNITAETTTPCKEGQERNPDTNRCRNIVKVSDANYAVLGAQNSKEDNKWYVWLAIGGVLLLALIYTVWEWRYELRKVLARVRMLVRIRK